jgi:putative transposase
MALLGIDVGLRNRVATSEGDLMGRNLIDRLVRLEKAISTLATDRQKQGLRVRCPGYDALTNRLRAFLKHEMHRVINRVIEVRAPQEIALESLDFRSPELSKRMNRLVQNFGRREFRDALNQKAQALGIIISQNQCRLYEPDLLEVRLRCEESSQWPGVQMRSLPTNHARGH